MRETLNGFEAGDGAPDLAAFDADPAPQKVKEQQNGQRPGEQPSAIGRQWAFAELLPPHPVVLDKDAARLVHRADAHGQFVISDAAPEVGVGASAERAMAWHRGRITAQSVTPEPIVDLCAVLTPFDIGQVLRAAGAGAVDGQRGRVLRQAHVLRRDADRQRGQGENEKSHQVAQHGKSPG